MSLTVNDTAPDLTGVLTSDGAPVNLAGASLALHVRRKDGTLLNAAPVVVDEAAGTWRYAWAVGDLAVSGAYQVEVQVTYADGRVQTFGPATVYVKDELA